LIELVRKRVVDPKEAYMLSVNKTEFNGMLNKEGFAIATGS
jgi:hypothetical protein